MTEVVRGPTYNLSDLREYQKAMLSEIEPGCIPQGTVIPIKMITNRLKPGSTILDAGCGSGDKAKELVKVGFKMAGIDLNPKAIDLAQSNHWEENKVKFIVDDITSKGLVKKLTQERVISEFDGVVAQAIFCNLIGIDAELGLENMRRLLKPGGWLFIADCLQADCSLVEQSISQQPENLFADVDLEKWQDRWRSRYQNNHGLGLDYGTFCVLPMGSGKEKEYGDTDEIISMIGEEKIERLARHYQKKEFLRLAAGAGFKKVSWRNVVWSSREGYPILGMLVELRKSE